ncbi:MAG: RHS repeat-associated core domain-containing protein [Bryobacterales bacterium]|nr:RHS repeat-associated core domain-containing protein [Bryobacterales bacterium]
MTPSVASATEAKVALAFPSNQWAGGSIYDLAGNVKELKLQSKHEYKYDAENRLVEATVPSTTAGNPSVVTTYSYDGDGRRVKVSGASTTLFVYDAMGNLAQEYGPLTSVSGTQFLTSDALGSTRLVTNRTSSQNACYDYLPFGEEIPAGQFGRTHSCFGAGVYPSAPGVTSLKFTAKERDAETGLDYFGARYFSAAQGRWTSPDRPFADQFPDDPQSWNLYSYVRNNPLRYIDDDGRGARELWLGLTNAVSSNAGAVQRIRSNDSDIGLGQKIGDVVSFAGGLIEMAGGGGIVAGGAAACGTGVLCAAGAPAAIGGTAIAGHGALLTGNATLNLMASAKDSPQSSGDSTSQDKPTLIDNPKHHPKSDSPQPKNARELFENSVADKSGVRWAKDADGTIHRFSAPSNGQSHWNGSTAGRKPIRQDDIPIEIRRELQ